MKKLLPLLVAFAASTGCMQKKPDGKLTSVSNLSPATDIVYFAVENDRQERDTFVLQAAHDPLVEMKTGMLDIVRTHAGATFSLTVDDETYSGEGTLTENNPFIHEKLQSITFRNISIATIQEFRKNSLNFPRTEWDLRHAHLIPQFKADK